MKIKAEVKFDANEFERKIIAQMEDKVRKRLAPLKLENLQVEIRKDRPGGELSIHFDEPEGVVEKARKLLLE